MLWIILYQLPPKTHAYLTKNHQINPIQNGAHNKDRYQSANSNLQNKNFND